VNVSRDCRLVSRSGLECRWLMLIDIFVDGLARRAAAD
jgi:hypothetical protein